jgi:NADH-quinone oxidoreductase subunit F
MDLYAYRKKGGYAALTRALTQLTPQKIIDEIKKSGLRGRGGAGFPTGKKWELAAQKKGQKKYVCCNAAEGEPGTYKDRTLIRTNPHQLIEGVIIASYAIGANEAYIFVKKSFQQEYEILCQAVDKTIEAGFLGEHILGTPFCLELKIFQGPNVYIAGEETAMLEAIEGRRAQPKQKPPFYPIQHGLFGKPTLVNNAETLCNIPHILRGGADWFLKLGHPKSPGTMIFTISGAVNRPGIYELPLGTPLRDLIYEYGGGIKGDKRFKAVFPGGPSQALLVEADLDVSLDFESLKQRGSGLGTGAIMVLSETACMVNVALYCSSFFMRESCGQCPPCKLGTIHMTQLLEKIEHGTAESKDLASLEQIFELIRGRGYCDLINSSVRSVESTLKHFREEYENHIRDKGCSFQPMLDHFTLIEPYQVVA